MVSDGNEFDCRAKEPQEFLYCYLINPIDFGWPNLQTVDSLASKLCAAEANQECEANQEWNKASSGRYMLRAAEFIRRWSDAKTIAKKHLCWEGDLRHSAAVFWLPFPAAAHFDFAFIFKQDNNGNTFVISPVELPWLSLGKYDLHVVVQRRRSPEGTDGGIMHYYGWDENMEKDTP